MCRLRLHRVMGATVLAAALMATPTLAADAPPRDAGPAASPLALLGDWWAELTGPLVSLIAPDQDGTGSTDGGDAVESTSDDPTADPENGLTVDPDG